MLVELDIFSGRPNPRWELDEPARRELEELEGKLSPGEAVEMEPPGLGYRGFLYAIGGERRRAFLGRLDRAGAPFDDPERSIERLLLGSIPAELAPLRGKVAPLLIPGGTAAP